MPNPLLIEGDSSITVPCDVCSEMFFAEIENSIELQLTLLKEKLPT
jgi:hypothetical protein